MHLIASYMLMLLISLPRQEASDKGFGKAYAAFGGGKEGLEACVALEALCEMSAIEKLLTAFIIPLQHDNISTDQNAKTSTDQSDDTSIDQSNATSTEKHHRIHCSLNLNTETGRLSARRPNLQNQPALEKDRYKVRAPQATCSTHAKQYLSIEVYCFFDTILL